MENKIILQEKLRAALFDAINEFDFVGAEAFYKSMDWKWCGEEYSPTSDELKRRAFQLGSNAIEAFVDEGIPSKASSGGLHVNVFEWKSSFEVEVLFTPVCSFKCVAK